MENYLVISALGEDRPGIINQLSKSVLDMGCNIDDSRMTVLGGEFAMQLLVSGQWNAIAKLESTLPALQQQLALTLVSKRTTGRKASGKALSYHIEVIAIDHPGIVYQLTNFFSERKINIQDLHTDRYLAAHTGTPMFAMHLTVNIPADQHVGSLREQFFQLIDELNLDAVMEPVKV